MVNSVGQSETILHLCLFDDEKEQIIDAYRDLNIILKSSKMYGHSIYAIKKQYKFRNRTRIYQFSKSCSQLRKV